MPVLLVFRLELPALLRPMFGFVLTVLLRRALLLVELMEKTEGRGDGGRREGGKRAGVMDPRSDPH